ncbi:hypothetical protein FRC08_002336 [Ceratobasidium sp. 394]|nr:hypothetical protein FRC08_002336 [Ceratobasidium sp. 394]
MTKLKNLERVYWGSTWSSARPQTLRDIQIHTKIQLADLQVELFHLNQVDAEKIFALEGLKKFHVTLSLTPQKQRDHWGTQDEEDENTNNFELLDLPSLLLEMLRASPNLEELCLTFKSPRWSSSPTDRRNPDNIFTALADHIFPRLRVFRIFEFWEHDESLGLRRFLLNHPNLHTVDLHLNLDMMLGFGVEDIETVFPSVRDFKGPLSICRSLTSSRVAEKLESLTIRTVYGIRYSHPPGPPGPYMQYSLLPRLQDLEVIDLVHIHDLVGMAPNIERIRMSGSLDVYFQNTASPDNFMNFLRQTPKLRILKLSLGDPDKIKRKPAADNVTWFMRQASSICPQLSRIEYSSWGDDPLAYWDIIHNKGGDVTFHYHFDPRSNLFLDLDFSTTSFSSGLGSPWRRFDEWYGSLDLV